VATDSNDSKDPEDLIKMADKAMYKAKEQGRNNYRFQTVALNNCTVRSTRDFLLTVKVPLVSPTKSENAANMVHATDGLSSTKISTLTKALAVRVRKGQDCRGFYWPSIPRSAHSIAF